MKTPSQRKYLKAIAIYSRGKEVKVLTIKMKNSFKKAADLKKMEFRIIEKKILPYTNSTEINLSINGETYMTQVKNRIYEDERQHVIANEIYRIVYHEIMKNVSKTCEQQIEEKLAKQGYTRSRGRPRMRISTRDVPEERKVKERENKFPTILLQ